MIDYINETPFAIYIDDQFSPIYQKKITQKTLVIPGGGCKIWRNTRGQVCTFCGFPMFARRLILGEGKKEHFESWMLNSETYWEMYLKGIDDPTKSDKFAIFNGGSFFVDDELPKEFQSDVLKDFSRRSGFKQLMVESRPEYLNECNIDEAKSLLGSKDLLVGIGLESVNTKVRSKLLRKAMSMEKFEVAVKLLKKYETQVFVYVMLGAPGLSESDALDDALQSIKFLTDLGVDQIAISSTFVAPDTSIHQWYDNGDFRPPWLWSVLEIMKQAQVNRWPVTIGGFDDDPKPVAIPSNCGVCDEQINRLIDTYRVKNLLNINDIPGCECSADWHHHRSLPSTWTLPSV